MHQPDKKQFGCLNLGLTTKEKLYTQWGRNIQITIMEDTRFVVVVPDFKGDDIPDEHGNPSGDKFVVVPKEVCQALRAEFKINIRKSNVPVKVRAGRAKTYYLADYLYTIIENVSREVEPNVWRMLGWAIPNHAMIRDVQATWNTLDSFMDSIRKVPLAAPAQRLVRQQSMHASRALEAAAASLKANGVETRTHLDVQICNNYITTLLN